MAGTGLHTNDTQRMALRKMFVLGHPLCGQRGLALRACCQQHPHECAFVLRLLHDMVIGAAQLLRMSF